MSFAEGLDVRPERVESRGHFLLARGKVLIKSFAGSGEAVIEVKVLDLLGQAAVDVIDAKTAGCRVARFNDIEEVVICELVPKAEAT